MSTKNLISAHYTQIFCLAVFIVPLIMPVKWWKHILMSAKTWLKYLKLPRSARKHNRGATTGLGRENYNWLRPGNPNGQGTRLVTSRKMRLERVSESGGRITFYSRVWMCLETTYLLDSCVDCKQGGCKVARVNIRVCLHSTNTHTTFLGSVWVLNYIKFNQLTQFHKSWHWLSRSFVEYDVFWKKTIQEKHVHTEVWCIVLLSIS